LRARLGRPDLASGRFRFIEKSAPAVDTGHPITMKDLFDQLTSRSSVLLTLNAGWKGTTVEFRLHAKSRGRAGPNPSSGTQFYYLADQLGRVRGLVDGSGTLRTTYDFPDPRGRRAPLNSGAPNDVDSDVGFAGLFHHVDPGGAIDPVQEFALKRAYSPVLYRWLSRDPLGTGAAFAQFSRLSATNLNLYAYAGNNPASAVDPFGLETYALGFNIGFAFGFGAGTGAHFEVGVLYDTDTSQIDLYMQTSNANGNTGIGGELGVGATLTRTETVDDFYGRGREMSLDLSVPAGPNFQLLYDEHGAYSGNSAGVSAGFGAGYFENETNTVPLFTVQAPCF
jgi:RHS repeat-associated protein